MRAAARVAERGLRVRDGSERLRGAKSPHCGKMARFAPFVVQICKLQRGKDLIRKCPENCSFWGKDSIVFLDNS